MSKRNFGVSRMGRVYDLPTSNEMPTPMDTKATPIPAYTWRKSGRFQILLLSLSLWLLCAVVMVFLADSVPREILAVLVMLGYGAGILTLLRWVDGWWTRTS